MLADTLTRTAPMTPAQGRYLTALLDQATAKDAQAGALFRTSAHQAFRMGTLDKANASLWIDALKKWVAAVHPAPAANVVKSTATRALRGPAPVGVQTHGAPSVRPAHRGGWQGDAPLTTAVREACAKAGVTPGARKAKATPVRGGAIMDSLRTWTPERAAEALAGGDLPF